MAGRFQCRPPGSRIRCGLPDARSAATARPGLLREDDQRASAWARSPPAAIGYCRNSPRIGFKASFRASSVARPERPPVVLRRAGEIRRPDRELLRAAARSTAVVDAADAVDTRTTPIRAGRLDARGGLLLAPTPTRTISLQVDTSRRPLSRRRPRPAPTRTVS